MRRGQAALEYLVTYGWALLGILVVIGAMAYFGFLSPSRYLPARCDFGAQLQCVDYQLQPSKIPQGPINGYDGIVLLQLQNNFADTINITRMWDSDGDEITEIKNADGEQLTNDVIDPSMKHLQIGQGNASVQIYAYFPETVMPDSDTTLLISGERQTVTVTVEFLRHFPDSPRHNITGVIFATVQ